MRHSQLRRPLILAALAAAILSVTACSSVPTDPNRPSYHSRVNNVDAMRCRMQTYCDSWSPAGKTPNVQEVEIASVREVVAANQGPDTGR